MRLNKFAMAALFLLFLASSVLAQKQATAVQAVQPDVQTAEWAESWWMPRHEQKLSEKDKMGRVDLLMIGDSITHGWEGAGKKVWDENYADKHALNIGFSGDRTEHVLWRLQHGEVEGISPKLAVIMIGTNNTGHRQDPPEQTAAGIKAIISELAERIPDTKVLLLGIFPRGADENDSLRQINDRINDIIKTFADDKKIFYLDFSDQFLDDDAKLPKSIMPDLLHPNEAGYQIWAKAMNPMIDQLMKP
jgi:lysophospholipase L1-like esterase